MTLCQAYAYFSYNEKYHHCISSLPNDKTNTFQIYYESFVPRHMMYFKVLHSNSFACSTKLLHLVYTWESILSHPFGAFNFWQGAWVSKVLTVGFFLSMTKFVQNQGHVLTRNHKPLIKLYMYWNDLATPKTANHFGFCSLRTII